MSAAHAGVYVRTVFDTIKKCPSTAQNRTKVHNDYSLLSGLIYCGKCKSRMFAKQRSGKSAKEGLYDYICNNKLRGGVELCASQNINGQQADDLVCEYLMQYTNESSEIYKLLEKLKHDLQGNDHGNPCEIIEAKIKKCNNEIENLINTLAQGNLGASFISRVNSRIEELDKEISSLENEKIQQNDRTKDTSEKEMQIAMLSTSLSSFKNNFDVLSIEEKRTLIKLMVKKIVWDGENLHIFIYGE
jgi:site-specific DNA recombinase